MCGPPTAQTIAACRLFTVIWLLRSISVTARLPFGVNVAVDIVTTLPGKLARRFRTNHDCGSGAAFEATTTAAVCDGLVCDVGAFKVLHCS